MTRYLLPAVATLVFFATGCSKTASTPPAPAVATPERAPRPQNFLDELRDAPAEDFVALIAEIRDVITQRLLTPSQHLAAEHADAIAAPDTGINRILERGRYEGLVEGRGGGAYFSFATAGNDYDARPDLALESGRFSSGFAGRNFGMVTIVDEATVDTIELRDVPAMYAAEDPVELYQTRESDRRNPLFAARPRASVGTTYVVRSVRWGEDDLLTAFTVVEQDDDGVTFVWKILKRFPAPDDEGFLNPPF